MRLRLRTISQGWWQVSEELIILIAQILIKYGPQAAAAFVNIFKVKNPTDADWQAVWDLAAKPL